MRLKDKMNENVINQNKIIKYIYCKKEFKVGSVFGF